MNVFKKRLVAGLDGAVALHLCFSLGTTGSLGKEKELDGTRARMLDT